MPTGRCISSPRTGWRNTAMTSQTRRKQRLTTHWNEHPRLGLAVPMADTRFLLFPLTMLIAQSSEKLFPFVGSSKTWFLLDRVHLEQQSRAIQVAWIAGGSDHICREICLLNQLCRESRIGFQASDIGRVVAKNKQGNIFVAMETLA